MVFSHVSLTSLKYGSFRRLQRRRISISELTFTWRDKMKILRLGLKSQNDRK